MELCWGLHDAHPTRLGISGPQSLRRSAARWYTIMPTASGRTLHAIDRQHHGMELSRDQLFSTPVPGNKQEGVFQICSILDAFQGSILSPESPCFHAVGFFHQHRCQGRELPKEVKVPHAEQQLFLHFVNTNMMWTCCLCRCQKPGERGFMGMHAGGLSQTPQVLAFMGCSRTGWSCFSAGNRFVSG